MRRTVAFLFEHLMGATITFVIAGLIIKFGPMVVHFVGDALREEYLHEILIFLAIMSMLLLAFAIRFSHDALRWIGFRWLLGESKVCGLYVETYLRQIEN